MLVCNNVNLDRYLTLLRGGMEYPMGGDTCIIPNMTEQYVLRLRNNTNVTAIMGVVLKGNGHVFQSAVTVGKGDLNAHGQMGAMTITANPSLEGPAAGDLHFNVRIEKKKWLELRGHITWANAPDNPGVQLVPEIADVEVLSAVDEPAGGFASPAPKPTPVK